MYNTDEMLTTVFLQFWYLHFFQNLDRMKLISQAPPVSSTKREQEMTLHSAFPSLKK